MTADAAPHSGDCGSSGFLASVPEMHVESAGDWEEIHGLEAEVFLPAAFVESKLPQRTIVGDALLRVVELADTILCNPAFLRGRRTTRFAVHVLQALKRGGMAGLILPDGLLIRRDRSAREFRTWLLQQFAVYCVISLPKGIFPTSRVKTSLLIVGRTAPRDCILFHEVPPAAAKAGPLQEAALQNALLLCKPWIRAMRNGDQPSPPQAGSWVESKESLMRRDCLLAVQTSAGEVIRLPAVEQLAADLLTRSQQLHALAERLHRSISAGAKGVV